MGLIAILLRTYKFRPLRFDHPSCARNNNKTEQCTWIPERHGPRAYLRVHRSVMLMDGVVQ
jgi:hypothetical protein